VGTPEQFGQENAGLAETLIITLEAGEDQIEIFRLDCSRK